MSNTIYLEVDSTYRNRSSFPEISDFEIQVSQSGARSKDKSLDGVSLSAPVSQWTSSRFNASVIGNIISVFTVPNTSSIATRFATDNTNLIVRSTLATPSLLQKTKNYYLSAIIRAQISAGPPATYSQRNISYYEWLSTDNTYDYARIVLSSPFSDSVLPIGTAIQLDIIDPTELTTNPPSVFVPNGYVGSNCYYGFYLYNETQNQYRKIINYDVSVNLALLESSVSGWNLGDNFSIRKELPFLEPSIISSSSKTTLQSISSNILSQSANYYNGDFIRIVPIGQYDRNQVAPTGEMRRIIGYTNNGVNVSFTFTPELSFSPNPASHKFEILNWSYDNSVDLACSGTLINEPELVCIELLNIILPNKTLNTEYGSRIAYYPYVYVELSNIASIGSALTNIIYSNNPNSSRMVFRACVDDMNQPQNSAFIKIDGDKMVQKMKFQANTTLRFRVFLPDGELFRVNDPEYFSPSKPNAKNQITALFAITRG